MNNPDKEKRSAPSVIMAYRKRQERAERLLMIFWLGMMALVLAAGYLVIRYLKPASPRTAAAPAASPVGPAGQAITQTLPLSNTLAAPPAMAVDQAAAPEAASAEIAAPTEAPADPGVISYTVKEGDTLAGIAANFEVGLGTLMSLNPLVTPEFLAVGDQLVLPGAGAAPTAPALPTSASAGELPIIEYQVAPGDTLAGIAARYGTTIDAIVFENGLESADQLSVGQKLRIRVATVTATPSALPPAPNEPAPTPAP